MSRSKLISFSILGGLVITIVLNIVGFSTNNRTLTGVLLWQDVVLAHAVGPGPLLFVDEQGTPHYEGTPVHLLIVPVGFLLSIPIYSIVSYFFLRILVSTKFSGKDEGTL